MPSLCIFNFRSQNQHTHRKTKKSVAKLNEFKIAFIKYKRQPNRETLVSTSLWALQGKHWHVHLLSAVSHQMKSKTKIEIETVVAVLNNLIHMDPNRWPSKKQTNVFRFFPCAFICLNIYSEIANDCDACKFIHIELQTWRNADFLWKKRLHSKMIRFD